MAAAPKVASRFTIGSHFSPPSPCRLCLRGVAANTARPAVTTARRTKTKPRRRSSREASSAATTRSATANTSSIQKPFTHSPGSALGSYTYTALDDGRRRAVSPSSALAVAAMQAGGAAVHDDGGLGVALVAHGGAGREAGALAGDGHGLVAARLRAGLGLLVAGLVGGALLGDQPLLLLAQLRVDDHADGL